MPRVAAALLLAATVLGACSSGNEAEPSRASVRVVSQNILHGMACPAETGRCRLDDRVTLFTRQLDRAGCPELVALQEANRDVVTRLRRVLPTVCGDRYEIVFDDDPGIDREVVLTTDDVLGSESVRLAGPLRSALWVRVAADVGPVDLVATHLASSSDDRPCDPTTCPEPCRADDTLNTCQARQAVRLLDDKTTPRSVGFLVGDLNAQPDERTIAVVRGQGYVDTHLAAGNPECDPTTGTGCTSGRVDDSLVDLTDATSKTTERIDYVFLATRRRCGTTRPTGVFAPRGGPVTDGLVFPSDHDAVEATVSCRTTDEDRAAATPARRRETGTTTTTGGSVPASTRNAVTTAFETLFSGREPDPEARLRALEDADLLRESFIERMESVGALATRTSVRIDSMRQRGPDAVDVRFSILLDGAVVLDALEGRANRMDGTWLVSRGTYCQVATLGVDTVPEPCRQSAP